MDKMAVNVREDLDSYSFQTKFQNDKEEMKEEDISNQLRSKADEEEGVLDGRDVKRAVLGSL